MDDAAQEPAPPVPKRRTRRRSRGPADKTKRDEPQLDEEVGRADSQGGETVVELPLSDLSESEVRFADHSDRLQAQPGGGTVAAPSISIEVAVARGFGRQLSAKLVRDAVLRVLQLEGLDRPVSADVLLVRDQEMRQVNATRRGVDEATDVLSFPLLHLAPGGSLASDLFVLPPEVPLHLGDVLVSADRVAPQAQEAGHSVERELAYLTVHGILHLLGYDHETRADRERMRNREEQVLRGLGLTRE